MDANDFLGGGEYLKKEQIQKPTLVTAKGFSQVEFDGEPKPKLVVEVEEFPEKVICNVTNVRILAELFETTKIEDWVGKKAVLFNDKSVVFNGRVGGLRFREPTPTELEVAQDVPF